MRAGDRATEFHQRCLGLGIKGVSLHSYRYAWAERALKSAYPERFAQQALGHNSKAVHLAYSKHAEVTVPSLNDWEKNWKMLEPEIKMPTVVRVDFQTEAPRWSPRRARRLRRWPARLVGSGNWIVGAGAKRMKPVGNLVSYRAQEQCGGVANLYC